MASAPRTFGRRLVVPGALATAAVAGSSVRREPPTTTSPSYAPARHKGKDKLLSRARPAPGQPVLLRHHAGARARRPQGRRRPGVVRQAAEAEQGQGPQGRPAPVLVAEPQAQPQRPLAAPDHRHRGRLRGHERLRPLVPAAPDDLEAPAVRGGRGVLGEPPARPGHRRRAVHAPRRLRQPDPRARARHVLRHAAGDHDPPGDAHLPRRRRVHQGAPEREPRPRAPRAAHRRPGQLRRERREELGPDPHRLVGRHVRVLEGRVPRRRPLPRHGRRSRASRTRTRRATARRSPASYLRYLAHHPDTAEHLATKLCAEVHRRQGVQGHDQEARARSTSRTTPRSCRCSRPWSPPTTSGTRSTTRSATRARTSWRRTAPSASRSDRRPRTRTTTTRRRVAALIWQAGSIGLVPFEWAQPNGQPIDDELVVVPGPADGLDGPALRARHGN